MILNNQDKVTMKHFYYIRCNIDLGEGFCAMQRIPCVCNGFARTQIYLTLATSLLVDWFRPSWVTPRGISSRRESRYVCRQSLTLNLGYPSSRGY